MDNNKCNCMNLRNRKKSEITTSFVFHSVSMPEQIIYDIYRQCMYILFILEEEFQDYKRVIRISNSKKGRQHNGQKKKTYTTIHKTLHRKLNIEHHEPHYKPVLNSGAPGRVGKYVLTVDILIKFFIGCLQRGTCPTIVYSALLYIRRCVPGDNIHLAFV